MRKQAVRPGPPGTGSLLVSADYRLAGARRGTARKRTRKQLAALDAGRRLTKAERERIALTGRKDAPEIDRAYDAAGEGDFAPLTRLSLRRASRLSMLHDAAVEEVEKTGLVVAEDVLDSNGRLVSSRRRISPAAEFALKSAETVGIAAEQMNITPRARGVAKKDDALAGFLDRQARLRESLALNAVTVEVEKIASKETP